MIDLVDDIMDYNNPFKDTFKADPEDIFINNNLFDDFDQNNKKDIKIVYDDISKDQNLNQNDVLFEKLPKRALKQQIIRPSKKLELAPNNIKKKYSKKYSLAKKWLKRAGYLDASDQQTIDYDNDANITDLEIRFEKLNDLNNKAELIKQVPVHLKNRLKQLSKKAEAASLVLHPQKRLPNDKLLKILRNTFALKEAQITRNNAYRLMQGEFDFSLKNILNKTLLFDTSKTNKEVIIDKIIESINDPLNDKYYIDHPSVTNSLILKQEDGR